MYQLYYYPNNASLAVHFLLHHMGLEHELLLVDRKAEFHKSAAYLKLNPAGRIPTLVDNGHAIFESAAICIHLCEQHPEHALIPALGSIERASFFQWLTYLNNTLQAELMVLYYPQRHTDDVGTINNVIAAQQDRVADALAVLNEQLQGNAFLLGDKISACDFFLFMLAEWSLKVPRSPLHFEHLAGYLQRLSTHPTIQAVCEIEGIDLCVFSRAGSSAKVVEK